MTNLQKTLRRQNAIRKAVAKIQRLRHRDERVLQYTKLRSIVRRWEADGYNPTNNSSSDVIENRRNRFLSYHLD